VLELAILGLLKEQDLHGYELKKRLADMLGLGSGVSFGSLYPALGRLEAAGAVQAIDVHGPGATIPGTGSLGGELAVFRARKSTVSRPRGRKVYAVTERGEALFEELLAAGSIPNDDERAFNLRLAFARYLPSEARIGMLERRRAYLLDRLTRTRDAIRNGWERLDAYTRSLLEHGNETTERDISWLDRLIAHERATADHSTGAADPIEPDRPQGFETPAGIDPSSETRDRPDGGRSEQPGESRRARLTERRAGRRSAPVQVQRDWAVSTAPTMPVPPASTQGGNTP
jgi:DNA-binding PadR family transcriptional regulator